MTNQENKIVVVAGTSHAMAHYYEILFPAMTMYIVKDLTVPVHRVIKAGFMLYLLYGCFAPVWGYLADKIDSKRILGISMVMAGSGAILTGFTQGLSMLWLSLGIIGIGIAAAHPAGMSLISKSVTERGKALGYFGIFGNIGICLAPLIGGIGGFYFGWRNLMIVSGIVGVLAGCLCLMLKVTENIDSDKVYTQTIPVKNAVTCFILLCCAMTIAGLIYRANIITLPVYFEENPTSLTRWLNQQKLLDVTQIMGTGGRVKTLGATLLISLAVFVGIIGQKIGGYTADRFDLRWGYLIFFVLGLPALFFMAFLSGWALVGVTSLFMIVSLGMQPIENSLVALLTPPKWRSTAYGIKFILAFGVGASSVWIVSMCITTWNTASVYLVLTVLQVLMVLLIGLLIFISRSIDMRQYSSKPESLES